LHEYEAQYQGRYDRKQNEPCCSYKSISSHFFASLSQKFVTDGLQPASQEKHGMVLAQYHGVHADAGLGGQFLEAAAFELVPHEGGALLRRQFVERGLDFVEEHAARVGRFRPGVARRQELLETQRLTGLFRPFWPREPGV